MRTLINGWRFFRRLMKQAGPYLLLELLLPGGTLLTVFLLMYRSGALAAFQPMSVMRREVAQAQVLIWASARRACTIQTD